MKKRKKTTKKSHECTKGHELIAEYILGEADTELTSDELRLHAKSCTNCKRLLLRLEPLVLRSLEPHVLFCLRPNREKPRERKELFAAIRRELPERVPACRECTEALGLIAAWASGDPNDGFPIELLLHILSCPDCDWLLPTVMRLVNTHALVPHIEMPLSVHLTLRATILRVVSPE